MTANSTPESHNAVVAEMRKQRHADPAFPEIRLFADRLQSAHARELAEQQAVHAAEVGHERWLRDIAESVTEATRDQRDNAVACADAAMGLLRDILPALACEDTYHPCSDLRARVNKMLALAGGRKKE